MSFAGVRNALDQYSQNAVRTGVESASPHRLIAGRLEKMERLGQAVPLYPYRYERTHTSVELRAQEADLVAAERRLVAADQRLPIVPCGGELTQARCGNALLDPGEAHLLGMTQDGHDHPRAGIASAHQCEHLVGRGQALPEPANASKTWRRLSAFFRACFVASWSRARALSSL